MKDEEAFFAVDNSIPSLTGRIDYVDTMSGDSLTIDGTSQVVLLVPAGLTIARVGDRLVIEREAVAMATPAIAVEGEAAQMQGQQQGAAETTVTQGSDMPVTQHQEEVLRSHPAEEQRQTAAESTAMPSTEHQRQALANGEQPDAAQAPGQGQSDILREAHVITAGIQADNGVIHVIDAVLVPPAVLETLEQQR
jgi:hypothetical protein